MGVRIDLARTAVRQRQFRLACTLLLLPSDYAISKKRRVWTNLDHRGSRTRIDELKVEMEQTLAETATAVDTPKERNV